MPRYEIVLFWSDEDEVFIAQAPELPSCMAHGDSPESALANIKHAIELWLEVARKHGDEIPVPKSRRLLVA